MPPAALRARLISRDREMMRLRGDEGPPSVLLSHFGLDFLAIRKTVLKYRLGWTGPSVWVERRPNTPSVIIPNDTNRGRFGPNSESDRVTTSRNTPLTYHAKFGRSGSYIASLEVRGSII
jgi:hypothetical protein